MSYAIKPIVKLGGDDSLFKIWKQSGKLALLEEKDTELRQKYVAFCAKQLNHFFAAARASVPAERWTADKRVGNRLLTTTNINGLIICMRKSLEADRLRDFDFYKAKFGGQLANFHFGRFKSSQYARMGAELYERFFAGGARR